MTPLHSTLHLYVYYRVAPGHAVPLRNAVQRMQAELGHKHGQTYALRRRTTLDTNGHETWMEIYENVGPGFEAALDRAVDQAALMQWIAGARHTEIFTE